MHKEIARGHCAPHQKSIEGVGAWAAGSRSCGPRDRIVYLAVTDTKETPAGAEPDRHVREDRTSIEIAAWTACQTSRSAAPRTDQETAGRPADSLAAQRARIDPPQVSSQKDQGDPRDF